MSKLYDDQLFDMSHKIIKDLQEGLDHDNLQVRFMEKFDHLCDDSRYIELVLLMSPFVSRERFWYFLVAINFATFAKTNLKMVTAEPRPTWVWSDLSDLGCSSSFGSPSGHSTRSSNLAFLVILDLFFASEWSQRKYPQLNKMTASTNMLAFVIVSLFCVSFWLLNLYDRVFLGAHTLN